MPEPGERSEAIRVQYQRVPAEYPDTQERWDSCPAHVFLWAQSGTQWVMFRCGACQMPRKLLVGAETVTCRDGDDSW